MVGYVNKKYKSGLLSLFCLFYREELQALLIGGHELQARASRGSQLSEDRRQLSVVSRQRTVLTYKK